MLSLFNNRQVKAIYLTSLLVQLVILLYFIVCFGVFFHIKLSKAFNHAAVLTDDLKML